ncbi:MAG TPA: hypothetical protein VHM70_28130 [Polyangiaceae bacterium]|nr:hypothetical protein [Polyangiaceae bacterium]
MSARKPSPSADGLVIRSRLFDLLDSALESASVIWIVGPAGAGKTTLVASYLQHAAKPHRYCRLGTHDRDPETLFDTLYTAAKVAPLERTPFPGVGLSVPAIFSRLVWRKILDPKCLFVVDDEHSLGDDDSLVQVVEQGALEAGALGSQLIVTSRRAPPRSLDAQRLTGELRVLDSDTLRCTPEESEQWIRLRLGDADAERVETLISMSQGWPVCLGLMLTHMRLGGELPNRAADAPQRLIQYFADEVLRLLPERARECLLWCALTPRASVEYVQTVASGPDALANLAELEERGLLCRRQAPHAVPYVHPILATACNHYGRAAFGVESWNDRVRQAADYLATRGDVDAAFQLLTQTEQLQHAAHWVVLHAPRLMATRRAGTVLHWLRCLSPAIREADAWLRYWWDALTYFAQDRIERLLAHHREFRAKGDVFGLYSSWMLIAQDLIADHWLIQLRAWLVTLDELFREHPLDAFPELQARVNQTRALAEYIQDPQKPTRDDLQALICQLAREGEDWGGPAVALTMIFWQGVFFRSYEDMDALRTTLEGLVTEAPRHRLLRLASAIAAGQKYWNLASQGSANTHWREAMRLARELGLPQLENALNASHAAMSTDADDLQSAREALDACRPAQGPGSVWANDVHLLARAWFELRSGAHGAAQQTMGKLAQFSVAAESPVARTLTIGLLSQIDLETGQLERALVRVRRGSETLGNTSALSRMTLGNLGVNLALRLGDHELARSMTQETLNAAQASGWYVVNVSRREQVATLCGFALEQGILAEVARTFIRRRHLTPPAQFDAQQWPWPIKVHALGPLRVVVSEGEHHLPRGKARELFCALLASGGRDVPVTRLEDALWPESDGDRARRAFDTTLHRLRQLLPTPDLLQLKDQRLSLSPRVCWLDLWTDASGLRARSGRPNDSLETELLASEPDTPWLLAARTRLRSTSYRADEQ